MTNPQCKSCIWKDQCYSDEHCDDYYPAISELEDAADGEMLQRHRDEFLEEWNVAVERHIFFA